MANVHPTEFGAVSQEAPPNVFPAPSPEEFQAVVQRLESAVRDLGRMRERAAASTHLVHLPPCPDGGTYRVYYVPAKSLQLEKSYRERYRVGSPDDLLLRAMDILGGYCGLLNVSEPEDGGDILIGLSTGLRAVLDTIGDVIELHSSYELMSP